MASAVRATVRGAVQGVGFRAASVEKARELGVMGWVRNDEDVVRAHLEGSEQAVLELLDFLREGPPGARVSEVEVEPAKVEGHEQFAVRGLSAGSFQVAELPGGQGYLLSLQVDGGLRAWHLPKQPSMDPAVKRMAIESSEAATASSQPSTWDEGSYEQGGRVPWPQALGRGHAVFVLHGSKLQGGFALQRTRPGPPAQWLLIKRRDERAPK